MSNNEKISPEKMITIILESAPLKIATIGKDVVLLNNSDHKSYITKKLVQDPSKFRPDVTHQVF